MAHTKAQGSSRNGRDSNAKRLGFKAYGGQFVTAGGVAMALLTIITILLQPLLERKAIVRIAPLRFVVFSLIIAYGVATRKIMDVGFFVRRCQHNEKSPAFSRRMMN